MSRSNTSQGNERQVDARRAAPDDDVTASEVAAYAYCAKAWHLEYVLARSPHDSMRERRVRGVAEHEAHGARLTAPKRASMLGRLALVLFFAAVVLAAVAAVIGRR